MPRGEEQLTLSVLLRLKDYDGHVVLGLERPRSSPFLSEA